MIRLFDPDDVRAMDQRAFDRGTEPLTLMERAAGHLARTVLTTGGRGYGLRVALVCGKGNNGGDGVAAARLLRAHGAYPVVCLAAGGAADLSPDAAVQLERWQTRGGRVTTSVAEALARADVAVDCLLGTGARGEVREPYRSAVAALEAFEGAVVACDIPTGVDATTGAVPGAAVHADVTVTLGAHKVGLWVWPARGHAGRLVLGELGIVEDADTPAAVVLEDPDVRELCPQPSPQAEKRDRGVVVVLAGSAGMAGAAVLTARGALAGGAGLVIVATTAAVRETVAGRVPEALTLALPPDHDDALAELAAQLERADALAVGPGLGLTDSAVALVRATVARAEVPVVLDADGLNAFRHDGDALADRKAPLLVATPHRRELARLVGPDTGDIWDERLARLPELARRWAATVIAKGPGTMAASPDGRRWINPTGSSALATGGTGDVLTGVAAALVAQAPRPEAAAAAVYVHGRAGQLAAARYGSRSVTALDVAGAVPAAFQSLEEPA